MYKLIANSIVHNLHAKKNFGCYVYSCKKELITLEYNVIMLYFLFLLIFWNINDHVRTEIKEKRIKINIGVVF